MEHDELEALLNEIDWDQPLSPLDLNLPTDPGIITLLCPSSPISPVVLPNQPPNPLVYKFVQSLTNTSIQFTDHLRPHGKSLESTFYCLQCVVPKLILIEPNRRNHPLIPLCQDDSALIEQLWEHRPETPEHLFRDQINFRKIRKFPNRSREKVVISVANLFEGLDRTPIYTTS